MTPFEPPPGRPSGPPPFPPPSHRGEPAGGHGQDPPPLGPPPGSGGGGGGGGRGVPSGLIVAVAALLGALVVAGVLVVVTGRGGDDTATPPGPGPTTPATDPPGTAPDAGPVPTPPSDVEPIACPAEVPEPICEAAEFVQLEVGRAFREFPTVELESDEAFQARLLADFEDGVEDLRSVGGTLAALGLLDPAVDLPETMRQLFSVGVLGFYDPETGELVVRGSDFTALARITIVHELVHALDDQWFELHRPEYDERDDEVVFGFTSIVEGHARIIENRYRETLSPEESAAAAREELDQLLGSDVDVFSIPPVLLELLVAPYDLGERLVQIILDEQGPAGLEAAFGDPPTTSEQVIHPERYLAREPMVAVPAPPADGAVVDEGVLGELGVVLWLEDAGAADGWGGDSYVTWRDGAASCTRVDLVMDTAEDLTELAAAVDGWALGDGRRGAERIEVAGQPGLRVTACAG
jgi:hypothetical protein